MFYIDTSVMVAALMEEASTSRAQIWLSAQVEGALAISDWTVTEYSSALSMKLRTRQIQGEHRSLALSTFNRVVADSFITLSASRQHFEAAARLRDRHELGIRAADALHLAIAMDASATLVTFDHLLQRAASSLGHPCLAP
ncbi:type II toxin-antitoxin system VapC family toxin [Rhizobium tumorigenes]|uniref:type II toxin-antitoxin system VapC family toxin n=1 Tax=Rhizobium tumorigenes TaxID=2041385 RepID=UPI00241C4672|nr:type II toxin-antitoxin system VapC family toxin [Rhizobium tumorigenes]WFR99606.1 type II toxin-antitoxin system VapC family toxin [Rhizobium tumorigenes]